ncbi:hypothetical protein BH11PSE11_BH11PSE11_11100 [soil metagenome]
MQRRLCIPVSAWALGLGCLMASPVALADSDTLIVYPAYGDTRQIVLEGRVIEDHQAAAQKSDDGWWSNLRGNARMMKNDDRKNVDVRLQVGDLVVNTRTDSEGYFRKPVEHATELAPGWHRILGFTDAASAEGELLIVPEENTVGIISDLDDTLLVSEVNSKMRLLSNTFLKNPLQRLAVDGAARLIRSIAARNPHAALAPIIYLSASPRQLQDNILRFLRHNDFPAGVLLTKRVSNDSSSDPIMNQIAYKTKKIEDIFSRLPQVRFTLLGDDGEHDPEIYNQIRLRFPDRVEKVMIRRVNPDPARPAFADQLDLTKAILALTDETKK